MYLRYCDKSESTKVEKPKRQISKFGERLYTYLKEHNISYPQLADKIGCDRAEISYYINRGRIPKWDRVKIISEITGVSFDDLFDNCGKYIGGFVEQNVGETVKKKTEEKDGDDIVNSGIEINNIANFRNKIRWYLQEHGIKQAAFCEQLGIVPITFSRWLYGQQNPSKEHLERLCELIDVDISEFVDGMDVENKEVEDENMSKDNDIKETTTCEANNRPKNVSVSYVSYKDVSEKRRKVEALKKAAETIIRNAESIVGSENSLTDLTVTIYMRSGETPRINVDKDLNIEW